MTRWLLAAGLILFCATAGAHRPSDAFLTLELHGAEVSGQWEIALRDVEAASGVDADHDGAITWGELRAAQPRLSVQLLRDLQVSGDGAACPMVVSNLLVNDRLEGRFAYFILKGSCPQGPVELKIGYRFLFDLDPSHRGILVLHTGAQSHTAVLGPSQPEVTVQLSAPSRWREFRDYFVEGIWHIWTGFDHILFLLALLLPAVLLRDGRQWKPVARLAPAFWSVLGVVTAFTLAHSITLSLAALDILRLPSRWVEAAIAASVLLAAINNLRPVATRRRWLVAFLFGLIHGFGFASALSELGLPDGSRLICLVAFNLGVETGQLAVVLAVMPLAYLLRRTALYRHVVLTLGSIAIAAVAAYWLWQRLI